ncbi:MAG: hypothetical protein P8X85_12895 [Desulfobacterales bacterium]|jgi:predicted nucleic acid-binding protein
MNVRGILIPVKWDKKGNVVSVAIATDDESEYLVEDQDLAGKLKSVLRQVIEVSGVVKRAHGKNIIKIKQWRCQNASEHKKTFNGRFDF